MGTLISIVVRAAVVMWCIHAMNDMMEVDYETRKLQKQILFWRKCKEKLDTHVIRLESQYKDAVL